MTEVINSAVLADCPFCGGKAEMLASDPPFNGTDKQVKIRCTKCHCASTTFLSGEMLFGNYISFEEAVKRAALAWNRRTVPFKKACKEKVK